MKIIRRVINGLLTGTVGLGLIVGFLTQLSRPATAVLFDERNFCIECTTMMVDTNGPTATFTVNSVLDVVDSNPGDGVCETASGNGVCTLRAAIQEANALAGADIIILPAGIYTLTISGAGEDEGATGDLDIRGDLTIIGDDPGTTIIDGNALDHVFHIFGEGGANVTLKNITIQNGNAPNTGSFPPLDGGGGIRAIGSQLILTILNCRIVNNNSNARGGGIFSIVDSVTIIDTHISHNFSQTGTGGFESALAGAVITVTNSVFADNNPRAAYFASGAVNVRDSQFIDNVALGWGGGIYFSDFSGSGQMILTNVILSGNQGQYGGAAVISGNSVVEIDNSQILNNRATQGGGAIYQRDGADVTIRNTTLAGNQIENTATSSGGAILLVGNAAKLTIQDSNLTSNLSPIYSGGAIANFAHNAVIAFTGTTFSNNHAAGFHGGAYWSNGQNVALNITGSAFDNNMANSSGGALFVRGMTNTVSITNSHFTQNSSNWYGGAIDVSGPGPTSDTIGILVNVEDTIFEGNTGSVGGGALAQGRGTLVAIKKASFINNAGGNGGAIHSSSDGMTGSAETRVENSTFSGNQATLSGGAIYGLTLSTIFHFTHVTIANNQADSDNNGTGKGGGIAMENNARAIFINSLLANNMDSGNGAPDCFNNIGIGGIHNLVSRVEGCNWTSDLGNLLGTIANPLAPHLETLTGSPAYHPLGIGSPAIDAGSLVSGYCLSTDQLGTTRPIDGNGDGEAVCDMGAVEAPQRIVTTIEPEVGGTLVFTNTQGNVTAVLVPAGAITETTTLVYTPISQVLAPPGYIFAGHAFDLAAYRQNVELPGFTFAAPVSLTIAYADSEVADLDEGSLIVAYWNGNTWLDAACDDYIRDVAANRLTTPICHLSRFALLGPVEVIRMIYLPVALRP